MMPTDFFDAHERHWLDAELLYKNTRLANADQLYGLSAECGLKRLMLIFGMPMNGDIPHKKKDKKHIDVIWSRYESYRSGHHRSVYALPSENPFDDWDISQRYLHRADFDDARVSPHREGAKSVHRMIHQAKLEGLI